MESAAPNARAVARLLLVCTLGISGQPKTAWILGPERMVKEIRKTLLEFGDCDPMQALRLVHDYLDGRTEPTER
jgi:hypothetical protein